MCAIESSQPSWVEGASNDKSTSNNNNNNHNNKDRSQRPLMRRSSSISELSFHFTSGSVASFAVILFSIYFPFLLAPFAAKETYHTAFYEYSVDTHHFDNTFWTYGTDYFLAFCMGCLIKSISTKHVLSATHAWRSRGLLACYLLSVTAGGIAHQFYTSIEQRNTWHFRCLWTICVGTVTAASGFMGSIGSELVRHDAAKEAQTGGDYWQVKRRGGSSSSITSYWSSLRVPELAEWFWVAFGCCTTAVCLAGGLSFQRPACDIFVAGITQFPSTFYMMMILACGLPLHPIRASTRIMGILGFILNAPLLPMYPLLVQYTNWSLASVNTLLHTWLLVAWGLQGLALRDIEIAIVKDATPPVTAVPVKRRAVGTKEHES